MVIVDPRVVSPGKMHIPRCRRFPIQSTVHATAIQCSTNDVLDADDGTIHSFACPCGSSQENAENGAQRKKNRWTDTEEKVLIELFGENEDKLRYRSFNSPEWQSIAFPASRSLSFLPRRERPLLAGNLSPGNCKKGADERTSKARNLPSSAKIKWQTSPKRTRP